MTHRLQFGTCLLMVTLIFFNTPFSLVQAEEDKTEQTSEKGKTPAGFEKGEKKSWGDREVPSGWSKGEKAGWGDSDRPPGLAKKSGEGIAKMKGKDKKGKSHGKKSGKKGK